MLPAGHKLNEPSPLFAKIEPARVEELKKQFAGKQSENGKVKNDVGGDVASLEAAVAQQVSFDTNISLMWSLVLILAIILKGIFVLHSLFCH